jgi:hypothetical protein
VDLLLGVAAFLMPDHHARFAVEPREAADDGGIVGESTVAVQLFEAFENAVRVVERVRPLRMTRDLRDLPRAELAVDVAGEGLTFFLEPRDLLGNVDGRIVLDEAQLFDLGFELRHGLLEIEEGRFHRSGFYVNTTRHPPRGGRSPPERRRRET